MDDEFFDNLLKATESKPNATKTKPESTARFDDDDDILAGLLSDSDEKDQKDLKQQNKGKRSAEADKIASDTSFLPDSPPATTRKPSNILDNLLAKSSKDSPKLRDDSSGDFESFGGYVPTPSSRSSDVTQRRLNRVTGLATKDDYDDSSGLLADGRSRSSVPSRRETQGRRGISPTIETTRSNDEKRPSTAVVPSSGNRVTRESSSDWLDLKDDKTNKQVKNPEVSVVSDDFEPIKDRRSRRTVSSSHSPAARPDGTDWLGTSESKQQPISVPQDLAETESKSGNFLDWLGTTKSSAGLDPAQKGSRIDAEIESVAKPESAVNRVTPSTVTTVPLNDLSSVTIGYETQLALIRTQIAEMHVKFSEEALSAAADSLDLQTKVRRLEFERNQMQKALEGLENRHKEELLALETSFKKRSQLIEESYRRRESRLQEELESITADQVEKQKNWDKERSDLVGCWQRKVDEATRERLEDLERLKELQRVTITDIKRDHESAIERLQQMKKLEVDSMSEATSHSRTLQLVVEQLKSNTIELGQLQLRVEGGHVSGLEERELLLETKDVQLRSMHEQLTKQREQNEQERLLLRQLIARLEEKLQKQTIVQDEERWTLSQERNQLELEKKMYEESKKSTLEQLEREKVQLQKSREFFFEEQKEVMQQLYNISSNKKLVNISNAMATDPLIALKSLKAQAEEENALRSISSERKRLDEFATRLASDKKTTERQRSELEEERTTINALALQVKQRSEEVEEMCLSATQTREEGYAALQEAKRLETELRKRQEAFSAHMEALKNKERHLAEERLSLSRLRKETSDSICGVSSPSSRIEIPDPMLMAWQIAAQKDEEFLQKENAFLRGLRMTQLASRTTPL